MLTSVMDMELRIRDLREDADFYKVSVDYLLGRTNVKTPYPKK